MILVLLIALVVRVVLVAHRHDPRHPRRHRTNNDPRRMLTMKVVSDSLTTLVSTVLPEDILWNGTVHADCSPKKRLLRPTASPPQRTQPCGVEALIQRVDAEGGKEQRAWQAPKDAPAADLDFGTPARTPDRHSTVPVRHPPHGVDDEAEDEADDEADDKRACGRAMAAASWRSLSTAFMSHVKFSRS